VEYREQRPTGITDPIERAITLNAQAEQIDSRRAKIDMHLRHDGRKHTVSDYEGNDLVMTSLRNVAGKRTS
jgi:hypothetical protein